MKLWWISVVIMLGLAAAGFLVWSIAGADRESGDLAPTAVESHGEEKLFGARRDGMTAEEPEPPTPAPAAADAAAADVVPSKPSGRGTIEILVLDHEEAVVAGCEVVLRRGWNHARYATTDAEGRTRFDDLEPWHYSFRIAATGSVQAKLEEGDLRKELVVRLPKPQTIAGRVRSVSGAAVGGAEILVRNFFPDGETWPVARSAADGSFAFEVYDRSLNLIARADGFGESPYVGVSTHAGDEVELVLADQGGSLELTVRALDDDATGYAILRHFADPSERFPVPAAQRYVAVDAGGPVTFDSLRPGSYRYAVFLEDHAVAEDSVLVLGVETLKREVVLGRGGAVTGVVSAAGRAEPVAGVSVSWQWDRSVQGPGIEVTTDAAGAYRIEHLPPGMVEIVAREQNISAEIDVLVAEGGETRADVELPRSAVLAGRCTDESGVPLADLGVTAHPPGAPHQMSGYAVTDRDGRFTMRVPAGEQRVVVSERSSMIQLTTRAWRPTDAELVIVIAASALSAGGVRGRLVDVDGEPMAGQVMLTRTSVDGTVHMRSAWIVATDHGRFVFDTVPPGTHRLMLPNHPRPAKLLATVEVGAEFVDLGDVVADVRDARLDVTLVGPDHLLTQGRIQLELVGDATRRSLERTERGFRILGAQPGAYAVVASGGIVPRVVPVTLAPDEEAELTLDVQPGIRCEVSWTGSEEAERGLDLLRIFGPDSDSVPVIDQRHRGGRGQRRSWCELGLGAHRFELVTSDGREARATFLVRESEENLVTLEPR